MIANTSPASKICQEKNGWYYWKVNLKKKNFKRPPFYPGGFVRPIDPRTLLVWGKMPPSLPPHAFHVLLKGLSSGDESACENALHIVLTRLQVRSRFGPTHVMCIKVSLHSRFIFDSNKFHFSPGCQTPTNSSCAMNYWSVTLPRVVQQKKKKKGHLPRWWAYDEGSSSRFQVFPTLVMLCCIKLQIS